MIRRTTSTRRRGDPGSARLGNAQFRRATVTGVDAARRRVVTDAGDEIGYDYLVLCCGVGANYFGIAGAAEHAGTVYTHADAIEVRDALRGNLEAYAQGRLRRYTAEELRKRGVELRLGVAVEEVHADGVVLSDGERLPSAVTVWSTGVKVDDQVAGWGLPQGRGGRIEVEPDMRVAGHPEIFAP